MVLWFVGVREEVRVILGNKVLGDFFCDGGLCMEWEIFYEPPFGSNGDREESVTGIVSHQLQRTLYQRLLRVVHRCLSLCLSVPFRQF